MNKMFLYFGLAMAGVYVAVGGYFIFFGTPLFDMPDWTRIATGVMLVIYGVFRYFRYRKIAKQE